MSVSPHSLAIEVAFATPERQWQESLRVPPGTTLLGAVRQSAFAREFPGLDPDSMPMGVHGRREKHPQQRTVEEGDRVELYRPLTADPKEIRRRRAAEGLRLKRRKRG
jgi:putative ubiquitin-RnfH superfamily antitoxin RatB of RatAB toxin-antitoxin module